MTDLNLLRPINPTEIDRVIDLFGGIHRTGARIFRAGWARGQADTWMSRLEGNFGAFSIIRCEDYHVCYAAFENDPAYPPLLEDLCALMDLAILGRGERPLFYNLRCDHPVLIRQLRLHGFKQDTQGYELVCSQLSDRPDDFPGLQVERYQERHFDAYVALLDEAFNPLMDRTGGRKNTFRRGQESLKMHLAERSKRGDFEAFWQKGVLVGLYYLTEDVIEVLAVNPAFQKRGFGRMILGKAVHRIIGAHCFPAAYLYVVLENMDAARLYLREGFRISGQFSENTFVGINC